MSKLTDKMIAIYERRYIWYSNFLDKFEILYDYIGAYRVYKEDFNKPIIQQGELTREQKREIDEFYLTNLGRKVPYLWHKVYYAYSGIFDPKYVPGTLFNGLFERYMDDNWPQYRISVSDKNFLPLIAQSAGVRMPKTLLSQTRGVWRDSEYNLLTEEEAYVRLQNIGEVFIKETIETYGGHGCYLADIRDAVDIRSGKPIREILTGIGTNIAVQERLKTHPILSDLNPGTVNTLRIMTYLWRDKIYTVPTVLRMGIAGNVVDNYSSGGIIIGVKDDGTLLPSAVSILNQRFSEHPDSKVKFDGYKIDKLPLLTEKCIELHRRMPQLGIVSWDMTIAEDGEPVLIEANIRNEAIDMAQMVHGMAPFGENTEDILRWMRQMRHVRPDKRYLYAYGKMKEEKK